MTIVMKVAEPEKVRVTMTITLPLQQWQNIRAELSNNFDTMELRMEIDNAIRLISRVVYGDSNGE